MLTQYERRTEMKKITVFIVIFILILTSCASNDTQEANMDVEIIKGLRDELNNLKLVQSELLNEMDSLIDKVSMVESSLTEKEEILRIYRMEIDSFYNAINGQDDYFDSRINEAIRLHGTNTLQEIMCLVEDYDFEERHITVKNQNDEVFKYNVSVDCKVLVVGQSYMIYQTLDEGKDFMDSVKQDDGNKVILVLRDNIVEQIKMYGHGNWR
jgi:DNA repair exonuclease SbcCD ATPase subunit